MSAGGVSGRRASFIGIAAGSAASILATGVGGLALWAAIAEAHSNPVEGMGAFSSWFRGVLSGVLAVVGSIFCVRASRSAPAARRGAALSLSVGSLLVSGVAAVFYLFALPLIFT